nr:hypothetical protein [Gammaproteobacteria bacterium]
RAQTPTFIGDNTALSFDSDMASEQVGAIHIKSVYDFGDGSNLNISTNDEVCFLTVCGEPAPLVSNLMDLADPGKNTSANQRPARFVRFVTPVALPDEDDPDLDPAPEIEREAFGPQRNQAMREIIGYAPVEPDGSVKVKVPANMAMAIDVLDIMGRRIGPRHQNWFHVRPGETMECTGCHTAGTQDPHHRKDAEAPSINPGAQQLNSVSGLYEFPNTLDPNTGLPYAGNMGESMAEVRFASLPTTDQPEISANIEFEDYWTDPNERAIDTAFNYRYRNLNSVAPASSTCDVNVLDEWDYRCRILINYKEHIHPLWSLPRPVDLDNDGNDDVDYQCTACHTNVDDVLMVDKVPDGQLDLTDGLSDQNNGARLKSYRELFFTDAGQELNAMDELVNITIDVQVPILDANGDPVLDANGDPTFDTVTIDDPNAAVAPSMNGAGARASYFMEKMTGTELDAGRALDNTTPHIGFMSDDELKLISEWLDIGAQYYNNPFDPQCALDGLC